MGESYFQRGSGRAAKVRLLFDRIARRYDLINDVQSLGMHRGWKRRMVELAGVRPGCRALDVCAGTGDIAMAMARRGAAVAGCDFSLPMLRVGEARRRGAGVLFVAGDALKLPMASGSFDVVTIAYGLRNLADLDGGLKELLRVLKPGGRLVALEFGHPENWLVRMGYMAYLRFAVPVFGALFCGDSRAYAYILDSLRAYPEARELLRRLESLGCAEAKWEPVLGGVMTLHTAVK